MSAVLTIIVRDLRARAKDRSAIVIAFIAPLALMLVFSATISGSESQTWHVGYLSSSQPTPMDSVLSQAILPAVGADGSVEITRFTDEESADDALSAGDVGALITTRVGARGSVGDVVVRRRSADDVTGSVADGIARAAVSAVNAVTSATGAVVRIRGLDAADAQEVGAIVAGQMVREAQGGISQIAEGSSAGGISARTQMAVGMATFFLFFAVQFGLLGLLQERREGTLARVLTAVPAQHVLIAKLAVSFVLGLLSMSVLLIAAQVFLGAELGAAMGVAVLVLCGVAAATATTALVVGLVSTPEQAAVAQSMVALVLGIVGGSFFSMARSGDVGQIATALTPHHWFLEGMIRLSEGSGWTAVVVPSLVLLAFACVVGVPGVILARRRVVP